VRHYSTYRNSVNEDRRELRLAKAELKRLETELLMHRPKYQIREDIEKQKKYIATL
jgi:hypothetical protein